MRTLNLISAHLRRENLFTLAQNKKIFDVTRRTYNGCTNC